jgi:serine phosphatase RsbU (regulator of sigma subunit)
VELMSRGVQRASKLSRGDGTGMHPADVVSAILEARERFTFSSIAEDDMTLMVASVEGVKPSETSTGTGNQPSFD